MIDSFFLQLTIPSIPLLFHLNQMLNIEFIIISQHVVGVRYKIKIKLPSLLSLLGSASQQQQQQVLPKWTSCLDEKTALQKWQNKIYRFQTLANPHLNLKLHVLNSLSKNIFQSIQLRITCYRNPFRNPAIQPKNTGEGVIRGITIR